MLESGLKFGRVECGETQEFLVKCWSMNNGLLVQNLILYNCSSKYLDYEIKNDGNAIQEVKT